MTTILNEAKKRFDLYDESGARVGLIEYVGANNHVLYATRTEFLDQDGQDYGTVLLDELATFAVRRNVKIVPICSFVKEEFDKYPEKYAPVILH